MTWTRVLADAWIGVRAGRWGSLVAVAALAIGIGASVTATTASYNAFLRPLPVVDGDRLVRVDRIFKPTAATSSVSAAELDRWRAALHGRADVTGASFDSVTLRGDAPPKAVDVEYVTDDWFGVLGARAAVGQLLDARSPGDAVVISDAFARGLANGAPVGGVLGRMLMLDDRTLQVVGVLPASFDAFDNAALWMSARGARAINLFGPSDARQYLMTARLMPGLSVAEFARAADAASADLVPEGQRGSWGVRVRSLRESRISDTRPILLVFLAGAWLVLLVACANVAMLLVNRAIARAREFAVRVALGASRGRLFVVSAIETTMLVAAGAMAGGWVAIACSRLLSAEIGLSVPALVTRASTTIIVAVTASTALCVVGVCAGAPVVVMRRRHLAGALRITAVTSSRGSRQVRAGLVIAQLALTVLLLCGAGLLGRTLLAVSRVDLGLDIAHRANVTVSTLEIPFSQSLTDAAGKRAATARILEHVRALPGVMAAGLGAALPPERSSVVFTIRYTNDRDVDRTQSFDLVAVTDGYFETLGARLVNGRFFAPGDALGDQPTAVLSESAARHLGLDPATAVGRDLNMTTPSAAGTRVRPRVIGIIKDIHYSGMDADAHGGVYISWAQLPGRNGYLVVRTSDAAAAVSAALPRIVHDADPSMPVNGVLTFSAVVDRALLPRTARFALVGVFAAAAALLGVVGLSGALVRSVVERRRELAIRAAIGASPHRLLRGVLRDGVVLTLVGLGLGFALTVAFARVLGALMFGVSPRDPVTFGLTAVFVLVIAFGAAWAPARRAARTDPALLLRTEG